MVCCSCRFLPVNPSGGLANLDSEVCENGDTRCVTGYTCNRDAQIGECLPPPSLSAVAPGLGSNLGGGLVEITGQGFQAGATLSIGGGPAIPTPLVSSSKLTATLPQTSSRTSMATRSPTLRSSTSATAAPRSRATWRSEATASGRQAGALITGGVHGAGGFLAAPAMASR